MLEAIGLTQNADQIYLEALKKPGQTVAELAQSISLPSGEAARSYQELADHGLLLQGTSQEVTVVSPAKAADILISRQEADLTAQRALLDERRLQAERLKVSLYHDAAAETETVIGADAINEKLNALNAMTESDVATLAPGGAYTTEQIEAAKAIDSEMLSRGIQTRTIFLSSVRNDQNTLAYVRWLNERGVEVRTVPKLPIRMIISDWKTAVLPLDLTDATQGIIIYRNPTIIHALQELFEMTWASGTPFGMKRYKDGPLSDEERVVLELLAIGRDDEEIAQRMGIVDRTARTKIKKLVERLGAKSHFEAGYRAVKDGWL